MEDIVAIRVKLTSGTSRYFLTWGRIPDAVDPEPLLSMVRKNLTGFDLGGTAKTVELCASLQDAAREPYFFEALFALSQRPIPFGTGYRAWRKRIQAGLENGAELRYLGRRRRKGKSIGHQTIEASQVVIPRYRSLT